MLTKRHHDSTSEYKKRSTFQSNTTGATSEAKTVCPSGAPESTPGFSGVRVTRSLFFCVVFCRSLFVPLSFFFWPSVCCLSFFFWPSVCCLSFELWILITPLVSSNSLFLHYGVKPIEGDVGLLCGMDHIHDGIQDNHYRPYTLYIICLDNQNVLHRGISVSPVYLIHSLNQLSY